MRRIGVIALLFLLAISSSAISQTNQPENYADANDVVSAVEDIWKPDPTVAAVKSLIVPGWGQSYNKKNLKAVVYSGLQCGLLYGVIRQHRLSVHYKRIGDSHNTEVFRNDRNQLTWWLAGVMILSVMDAYVDAHLYDFDVKVEMTSSPISEKNKFEGASIGFIIRF